MDQFLTQEYTNLSDIFKQYWEEQHIFYFIFEDKGIMNRSSDQRALHL